MYINTTLTQKNQQLRMGSCRVPVKGNKKRLSFIEEHDILFFFFFVPPSAECRAFRNQDRKSTPSPGKEGRVQHVKAGN